MPIRKLAILIPVCIFIFFKSYAQNEQPKAYSDSMTFVDVKSKCGTDRESKTVKYEKGKVIRQSGGNTYVLIDTNGLYIYICYKSHYVGHSKYAYNWEGYFSIGPCGKIEDLNYISLKKRFGEEYPDFITEIHKINDNELFRQKNKDNLTTVNELYSHYAIKSK